MLETDRLKFILEHPTSLSRRFRLHGTKEELVSGSPKQKLELSFIDGNFWQLKLRKEDPSGEIRVQWKPGLQSPVVSEVDSCTWWSTEQVQNVRDKLLVLVISLIGLVPGSLSNETMPWRQSGQGIEPIGPLATTQELFVEQRYKAHCVQNSWSQPAPQDIMDHCLGHARICKAMAIIPTLEQLMVT